MNNSGLEVFFHDRAELFYIEGFLQVGVCAGRGS
jgi:hypothetical protein